MGLIHVSSTTASTLTFRGRPNFGFSFGFGAECGQMGAFGGHSVSAESSRTTFGALSGFRRAAVSKFGGCRKYGTELELRRQRMCQTQGVISLTVY